MKTRTHSGAERRKQAILTAARAMLNREPLSSRKLAEAAGVSRATGSVLAQTADLRRALRHAARRTGATAAGQRPSPRFFRMLHAIHLFGQELHAEPTFFRALMAVIYAGPEDPAPSTSRN